MRDLELITTLTNDAVQAVPWVHQNIERRPDDSISLLVFGANAGDSNSSREWPRKRSRQTNATSEISGRRASPGGRDAKLPLRADLAASTRPRRECDRHLILKPEVFAGGIHLRDRTIADPFGLGRR